MRRNDLKLSAVVAVLGLLVGCAGLPRIQVDPLVQDIAAYELGYRFGQNNPELVPVATEVCDAILGSNDERFIQDLALASILSLSERLDNEHDRALIARIAKGLTITKPTPTEDNPKPPPYLFDGTTIRDIKVVVKAFKEGMGVL